MPGTVGGGRVVRSRAVENAACALPSDGVATAVASSQHVLARVGEGADGAQILAPSLLIEAPRRATAAAQRQAAVVAADAGGHGAVRAHRPSRRLAANEEEQERDQNEDTT